MLNIKLSYGGYLNLKSKIIVYYFLSENMYDDSFRDKMIENFWFKD